MLWLEAVSDGDGLMYDYFTEWNRFPMKASWRSGKEAFPLDLWRGGERLRPLVAAHKGIKDKMRLTGVAIHRINPSQGDLKAQNLNVQDFTNQWFVEFNWVVESPPTSDGRFATNENAVMLLDGTIPIKKLALDHYGTVRNTTNALTRVASPPVDALADPEMKFLDQLLEERKKRLRRINLGAGSAAACKYLREHVADSGDLELREIWLHFGPVKPFESESLREVADNADWMARFIFDKRPTLRGEYYVETLFDERIQATQVPSP